MREPHQTARERRARVKVCNMLLPDLFKTSLWNPDDPRFLFKDIKTGAVLLLAMELMAYGGAFGKDFDDQVVNLQAWKSPQLAHAYALWPFRVHAMTCVLKKQLQEKAGSSVVQSWMRVRCVATQDYHFSPCVAAISLWLGTLLSSPAFGVKPKTRWCPADWHRPRGNAPPLVRAVVSRSLLTSESRSCQLRVTSLRRLPQNSLVQAMSMTRCRPPPMFVGNGFVDCFLVYVF